MGRNRTVERKDSFGLALLTVAAGLICFFVLAGLPTTFQSMKTVLAGFIILGIAAIAFSVARQRAKEQSGSTQDKRNDFAERPENLQLDHSPTNTGDGTTPPPIPTAQAKEPGETHQDSQWSGLKSSEAWSVAEIEEEMRNIDWYQFEKLCAAILLGEGNNVERAGGAKADGGVDLTVTKSGVKTLIQCKQWRKWKIKVGTVREMLGSMTHLSVDSGAIYTLNGATRPAKEFAILHGITFVTSEDLALRARAALTDEDLDRLLDSSTHQCPRCDAEMILKTGDFRPFWGCSTFPCCRGTIEHVEPA